MEKQVLKQFDIKRGSKVVQTDFFAPDGVQVRVNQLTFKSGVAHTAVFTGREIVDGDDVLSDAVVPDVEFNLAPSNGSKALASRPNEKELEGQTK